MGNDMNDQYNDVNYIDLCDVPIEWRELLRVWRNKPRVRAEMCFNEEISSEEHSLWLEKVLSSGSTDKIRIAVLNRVPFGMVRLMDINYKNCSSDWGLYIGDEQFLGLGLGKKMLAYLIKWAFVEERLKELHTKVRKKNIKANSIYTNAGFHVVGETEDFYIMSLNSFDDIKIWTVGQGGNGRQMPLEYKRQFAWVFVSAHLPICIDSGALVEIEPELKDARLKWRDIVFKLNSHSDIEILAGKLPHADALIPKNFPLDSEWGYIAFDTKSDLGFSALRAASINEFKKVITFCDNSINFALNANRPKIEVLAQEHKDNFEEISSRLDNLMAFADYSLSGVDNPLELTEKIVNYPFIKGISVKNDLTVREQELPRKIIEMIQDYGFKGTTQSNAFVGFRE